MAAGDDKSDGKASESAEAEDRRTRTSRAAASDKPTYSVERLVADAPGFLGCESYVAAGALSDASGDMTVTDAKAAVKEWLKREIDPPEEE
jgi:hypothetical protein